MSVRIVPARASLPRAQRKPRNLDDLPRRVAAQNFSRALPVAARQAAVLDRPADTMLIAALWCYPARAVRRRVSGNRRGVSGGRAFSWSLAFVLTSPRWSETPWAALRPAIGGWLTAIQPDLLDSGGQIW